MIIPQYRAGCPHVTHPSATKINKNPAEALILSIFVRLACVKHAASVHPEPGSNSYIKVFVPSQFFWLTPVFLNRQNLVHYLISFRWQNWLWVVFIHIHCSVFKDQSAFQQRRLFYQIFIFLSSIIFHTWFDFVCCFSTANDILSSIIQFVKHFLFIFLCLFSLFMSADISISSVALLVNVFLSKHSLLTNAYTLFPTAFVQRHLFIIHA